MKNRLYVYGVLGCLMSTTVHADLYLGVKAGSMLIGFDDVEVSDDPVSAAASIGYQFDRFPRLSIEAEVSRTVTPGLVAGNDLEVDSQGVYLSYTSAGRFYLKGRLGYMDAALSAGELSEDEGGETYGVAMGLRLPGFNVELDYTSIDDDVSFISLGLRI